jgi:tetratricopeptide (TPR) repeat protein
MVRTCLWVITALIFVTVISACDSGLAPGPVPATPTLSSDPLARGIARYEREDYFGAIKELSEVLKSDPENVEALYRRGWSYVSTNDADLGYADLNRMVAVAPEDARGYYGRGWAGYVRSQGNPTVLQDSLSDLDKAIELKPDYAEAYSDRGTIRYTLGETEAALKDYSRALELNPDYSFAYFNRGVIYRELDEVDKALADFNRLIELEPDDAEAYYNRANAYGYKGEKALAIADYNKALELARDPLLRTDIEEEMKALESAP